MARKQIHVEQQTQKRRGTGVTAYNPEKACQGFTLFAPIASDGRVFLIDMEGKIVHQWKLPYPPGHYGYLLANGNLFYNGWVLPSSDFHYPLRPVSKAGAILEVNWEGKIVWEYLNPNHHHDARRMKNGNNILLTIEKTPEDTARKIKGGIPGSEQENRMWSDRIIEITPGGNIVWEWHSWEHLDQLIEQPITPQDSRDHWPMANSVEEIPSGDILVSFRNISTVVIISKKSGEIVWKLGHDVLAQQHAPTFLANGNILIFDNGTQRKSTPQTFSRVIEIDPETKEIVWEYHDRPAFNFYSAYISGARRLANGNTLITEGLNGRIFEVTLDGEVVWEYVNPYFSKMPDSRDTTKMFEESNSIFRAFRYTPEELPYLKGD